MTMHALMTTKEALVISERLRSWCLKNADIDWSYLDIIVLSIFLLSLIYEILYGNAPGVLFDISYIFVEIKKFGEIQRCSQP